MMIVETRRSSFEEPAESWNADSSAFVRGSTEASSLSSSPDIWGDEYDSDSQTLRDSNVATFPFLVGAKNLVQQGRPWWVRLVLAALFALVGVGIWRRASYRASIKSEEGDNHEPLGDQQTSPSFVPFGSNRPSLRPGDRDPWLSMQSKPPSPNTDHTKACLAVLGVADSDRDGFISIYEYPRLVSLMSGGAMGSTDYDSLPPVLITNFETLAGDARGISIGDVSTLLLEGGEETETAQADRVCDSTLSTVDDLKKPKPDGSNEHEAANSSTEGTSASPTDPFASIYFPVDSPSEAIDDSDGGSCWALLIASDENNDGTLSTTEFLAVVNMLSPGKFVGTPYNDLPDSLIAEYETLAKHGASYGIPIHAAGARDNASICNGMMMAVSEHMAEQPSTPHTSNGVPFPCCDWGDGYCTAPDNRWCHQSEDHCLACDGSKYHTGEGEPMPSTMTFSNGVPIPCCSWPDGTGQCSQATNHWCHGSSENCMNHCNGEAWITEAPPGEGSSTTSPSKPEAFSNGIPMPCCSWSDGTGECSSPLNTSCHASRDHCIHQCNGAAWLEAVDMDQTTITGEPFYTMTAVPEPDDTKTTSPTGAPTRTSTINVEVEVVVPAPILRSNDGFTSYETFQMLDHLTFKVRDDDNNPKYTLLSSPRNAKDGGQVASEGQGYALLVSGIVLASWETHGTGNPNDRDKITQYFHGYFNAWKDMCRHSTGPCQNIDEHFCGPKSAPSVCLPGWKHDSMAMREEAAGSVADGDEDAIVGMIFAVRAFASEDQKPVWYEEVRDWAERSCTSFLKYTTTEKEQHRLLTLGSCWGGWAPNGNNPSYLGTGAFKVMRDYQTSYSGREYELPSFGRYSTGTLSNHWDSLIATSYDVLSAVQCPDQGMVPNWATVSTKDRRIADAGMTFSDAGIPQHEFGSEAGRTMWRMAMDAVMFPEDRWEEPRNSLIEPIVRRLADHYNPHYYRLFEPEAFTTCSADGVHNITSFEDGWRENTFLYGPLVSTLVVGFPTIADRQQEILDSVAKYLKNNDVSEHYYPRCWTALTSLMLNGAVASASRTMS